MNVKRIYYDRKLIPLGELIKARTKKVNELIDNFPNVVATGDKAKIEHNIHRIDEYSSIVDYLRELQFLQR